jgi:hypothetical protein
VTDTSVKMTRKLENTLTVLKEILDQNPTRTYINRALFKDKRRMDTISTDEYFTQNPSHRSQSQTPVVTFNDLYEEVEKNEKAYKNPIKLSLKQLESKKRERITLINEKEDHSKIVQKHKFESMQLFDTGTRNFLTYSQFR